MDELQEKNNRIKRSNTSSIPSSYQARVFLQGTLGPAHSRGRLASGGAGGRNTGGFGHPKTSIEGTYLRPSSRGSGEQDCRWCLGLQVLGSKKLKSQITFLSDTPAPSQTTFSSVEAYSKTPKRVDASTRIGEIFLKTHPVNSLKQPSPHTPRHPQARAGSPQ